MVRKATKLAVVTFLLFMMFSAYTAMAASDAVYEAEDATHTGLDVSTDKYEGFSGKGYVNLGEGPTIDFKVTAPADGTYDVVIHYLLPADFGAKKNIIIVNGKDLGEIDFPTTEKFVDLPAFKADLKKGDNTITIKKSWGWIMLDYIKVVGGGSDDAAAAPAKADDSAKADNSAKTSDKPAAENPKTGDNGIAVYAVAAAAAVAGLVVIRRKRFN